MHVTKNNEYDIFQVEITRGCLRNSKKNFRGVLFAAPCIVDYRVNSGTWFLHVVAVDVDVASI